MSNFETWYQQDEWVSHHVEDMDEKELIEQLRKSYAECWQAAQQAEREECAILCEKSDRYRGDYFAAKQAKLDAMEKELISADTENNHLEGELEKLQAKLDAKAKELAALRGFVQAMREYFAEPSRKGEIFESLAIEYELIDAEGNPTPLLTGKK